jgi:hypothetical protein
VNAKVLGDCRKALALFVHRSHLCDILGCQLAKRMRGTLLLYENKLRLHVLPPFCCFEEFG